MVNLTSEAVDNTAQVCVACFGFRNMPRRVGQPPQIEITRRAKEVPKDFLLSSPSSRFFLISNPNALLGDSLYVDRWARRKHRTASKLSAAFLTSKRRALAPRIPDVPTDAAQHGQPNNASRDDDPRPKPGNTAKPRMG